MKLSAATTNTPTTAAALPTMRCSDLEFLRWRHRRMVPATGKPGRWQLAFSAFAVVSAAIPAEQPLGSPSQPEFSPQQRQANRKPQNTSTSTFPAQPTPRPSAAEGVRVAKPPLARRSRAKQNEAGRLALSASRIQPQTRGTIRARTRTASSLFRGHLWPSERFVCAPHRQDHERTLNHRHAT